MSNERLPLNPRALRDGPPAQYDDEFASSADEDNSAYVRVHRRTVYCLLGYALLASILALACLLALLLRSSTDSSQQQPMQHLPPPAPLPMPSDPLSPLHSPLPAHRSWNQSHLGYFLVLTDIHLEPHYNPTAPSARLGVCRDDRHVDVCKRTDWELEASHHKQSAVSVSGSYHFGRYMCDPPHSLVSTALRSLARDLAALQLDLILLPGDLAAHFTTCPHTLWSTINRTIELVTTAFPSTPVIFAIGNTDTHPTSSLPLVHSEPGPASPQSGCRTVFSSLLGLLLLHGVLDDRSDAAAVHTFCHGGYYSRQVNHGRIRILSLNTLVWAEDLFDGSQVLSRPLDFTKTTPIPCHERPGDPFEQLEWLEDEVQLAGESRQHVWLVGHIPPGVKSGQQGWCWQYWQRVERLLHRYESVITQLQFGDYSQDMIRLVQRSSDTSSRSTQHQQQPSPPSAVSVSHIININPGLTPRKNVNPAARVYTYNKQTTQTIDYQQFYIDLTRTHTTHPHTTTNTQHPHWLFQYSALAAYPLSEYTPAGWLDALRRMRWGGDGVLLERYVRSVNVWKVGVGDGVDYLCDVMVLGLDENLRCKRTGVVPGLEGEEGEEGEEEEEQVEEDD